MTLQRKKRATLRDVAARANVSTAVVSYVINRGPRPTSPEVRDRVLAAIAELDYHPNGFARGLRARRTHTIGFVTNDYHPLESMSSHYLASILNVLVTELKRRGYYLLLYPLMIGEDLAALEDLLRGGRLDGLFLRLIQDPPATDDLLTLVTEADIPCICIERPADPRFGLTGVTYDDAGGASLATHHLFAKGHRRIAHLQGDVRYATALARLTGYKQALHECGLPIDERLIRVADWSMSEAAAALDDLLQLDDPPTAVFAASDDMALGVLERLRALGRRVPEDFAIVGFDGIPLTQDVTPPLTTIRVPFNEIGRRAAELLLGGAHHTADGTPVVLPVELIEAQSA
ncbi:MAG TPA: LacI family DNA-binding transcriptional regulator [Thermomicrobiales bacterium]|nr:LacI family DNA-binding transcriptional regulator [Thermomicrobiales bacterium]